MSDVLDLYLEEIDNNITAVDAECSGQCSEAKIKKLLKVLDDTLKQAQREARMATGDSGVALKVKVEAYKSKIAAKKAEAEKVMLTKGGNAAGSKGSSASKSLDDRKRLQDVNEKLAKQYDTIDRCHHIVSETEAVGVDILNELGENREKLNEITEKSKEVNTQLDDASTRMKRMQRREDAGGCTLM